MLRTQVQFTEEQGRRLRRLAAEMGVSVSELVRRGVELLLRSEEEPPGADVHERALAAVGRFRSGCRDIAAEHDRYLDEAFGA
ncbi:MAG: ribbon-helix-helix domain-containing protein [Acidobacteria bacterium]|nr:ribbon-helix-helix domain-containing protein [Acidobacteriota bacterium]